MNTRHFFILILFIMPVFSCKSPKESQKQEDKGSAQIQTIENSGNGNLKTVVGIGKIEPETKLMPLYSERGGIIDTILRKEGESLKTGDIIMIINSDIEKLETDKIKSRILVKQNQLRFDNATIAETEARIENKRNLLERSRELASVGAETPQNLIDLETEYKVLMAELEKNRASLAITESEIRELNADLRTAFAEVNKRILRAPADGILLDLLPTIGSAVGQYGKLAEFAPKGRLIARCEIDELFASRVREGQTAEITLVGSSEVLATGKVVKTTPFLKRKSLFSELAGDKEDRRVMEINILLDDMPDLLYNTQVECIIKTE